MEERGREKDSLKRGGERRDTAIPGSVLTNRHWASREPGAPSGCISHRSDGVQALGPSATTSQACLLGAAGWNCCLYRKLVLQTDARLSWAPIAAQTQPLVPAAASLALREMQGTEGRHVLPHSHRPGIPPVVPKASAQEDD